MTTCSNTPTTHPAYWHILSRREQMQLAAKAEAFPSSHWSVIVRACDSDPDLARCALRELCERYWYPLYAFVRRQVKTGHEAEDVTQGFFKYLLERDVLASADQARGRFRTYLLACCKHFLLNHQRSIRAEKRGGAVVVVGLDFTMAARQYSLEPADPNDPDLLYLRRWAFTLLEETLAALEAKYAADGHADLFSRLRPTLTGDPQAQGYAAIGEALGLTENAVKKSAQRLRRQFGEELRRRIADTVDDPAEVEQEIRDLFAAIR